MELVKFVCEFISSNPFIVSSDELSYIKKQLLREGDDLKIKQKAGSLHYRASQGRYAMVQCKEKLWTKCALNVGD